MRVDAGRELRRWWATARLASTAQLGEGWLFLVDYGMRALRVAILLSIWRTLLAARPEASPLPLETLLLYTVIAEAFAQPMAARTQLADVIWQGSLVHYFLRPTGIVRQLAAGASGQWLLDFIFFSLPLLLVATLLLGVDVRPVSLEALPLFALSLLLAVAVGLAIEFAFGAIALSSEQPVWLVEWVRRALAGILSGALVPLSVLPFGLGAVFAWLPFASTAWAPLAIYTGADEAGRLLATQLGWALSLWPAALWLWRRNREKVAGHGG